MANTGKGSNSSGLRRYNERVILTTLRQKGAASKSDLARASNLTAQAVTRIVDEMEAEGLVMREGRRLGGKGQPSTLYAIDPKGAFSIGIKVARRELELLLMDFGGTIVEKICHDYDHPHPAFILETIEREIPVLQSRLSHADADRLMGLGVAMPWFMGAWTEELQMSDALAKQWNEINFADEITKRTDLPVYFENDCSAAAIAELLFGCGIKIPNFLYVFLGTFVGGGLILEGGLEVGVHGNSGHVASMPVPPSVLDSAPALNGAIATLLDRSSMFVLRRHLAAHGVNIAGIDDLPDVMDTARPFVQEWLDDCANALVYAFQSAIALLDLEAIVIDSYLPRYLVDELVEMISRRFMSEAPKHIFAPEIRAGKVGVDAIAIGGAMLPVYSKFAPDKTVLLKGGVPQRIAS